jgi:uncharacterized protein
VTYLLDVNALLALGYQGHVHHSKIGAWLQEGKADNQFRLATCSITELGFVRVATSSAALALDIATAKAALARLKSNSSVAFTFLTDNRGADALPLWVQKSSQTTDGHLLDLASASGAKLLTFDAGIPGAEIIK